MTVREESKTKSAKFDTDMVLSFESLLFPLLMKASPEVDTSFTVRKKKEGEHRKTFAVKDGRDKKIKVHRTRRHLLYPRGKDEKE